MPWIVPLVVLGSREVAHTEQLVQQSPHMLTSNGTALQRGLDAKPHKDEEQGRGSQLLDTLHRFLRQHTEGRKPSVLGLQPT